MKIGVNARLLGKPFTGIGQVTKNLFKELSKIDGDNEYFLVVHEKVDESIEKLFGKNVEIVVLPERDYRHAGLRKTWWEQSIVPEYFQKIGVDVAWFTYPCNPWYESFYKTGIKTIVTVHDTIPWTDKRYNRAVLSRLYHSQTKKAVKRADVIFTVSTSSKKEIRKVCGVKKDKIKVIYNDAGEVYKKPIEKKYIDDILAKFNLTNGKFFLYVGGYDPRKNVASLISQYKNKYPLVLAGGKLFDNKMYSSFDSPGVIKTGFLSEDELAVLYSSCTAYINLSEKEGFNICLLEAANCGAPLILSDIPVHREVAEGSAIFMKKNLDKALENCLKKRAVFKKRSLSLAEKYSWEKSAQIARGFLRSI